MNQENADAIMEQDMEEHKETSEVCMCRQICKNSVVCWSYVLIINQY